jgi:hypothetical protein
MRRWILASQAEKMGRLYWSTQRGWTYKELASLYREQTRETVQELQTQAIWFEVEVDFRGIITVLEAPQPLERPEDAEWVDLRSILFPTANREPSRLRRRFGAPTRVEVYEGYNVNVYRKAAS